MQIKGDEFIKKVQIQQEREELERKLNELEEVEMSINTDSVILERNNTNDYNSNSYNNIEPNEHELDNIMLGSSNANEDNKKKYLILGIVLVVLFLLTIIIIRLLTGDAPKEDQFTSNSASSTEMKKLQDSDNIEENFQKIINERVKKDTNEPMVPEVHNSASKPQNNQKAEDSNTLQAFENLQKEAESYNSKSTGISDEAIDQTIKKVERSKSSGQKEKVSTTPASTQKEEIVTKKVETKKSSIKDLVETPSENAVSTNMSSGYFIQIGAFTKKPTDSYVNTIRSAKLKYKIYQDTVNGVAYNKVLIGPYSSKAAASENVEDVKQKLSVSSAFVVKF